MINPYVHNKTEKHQNKKQKKKKKSKDVFQHMIERIFVFTEETLWKQRNLDRHQPDNTNVVACCLLLNHKESDSLIVTKKNDPKSLLKIYPIMIIIN